MTRVPLRWKLTMAFAAALAVVLVGLGVFLYLRLAADLDGALERDLQARSDALVGLVAHSSVSLNRPQTAALEADEDIAQILRPDGAVVAASSYANVRLLSPDQLHAATHAPLWADRPGEGVLDESLRLLATPVPARGESFLVVVCTSLDERNEALANLTRVEIVGLAGALLACCVVGYHVAGLALRPVEALRSRAAEITPEGLAPESRLLPVSAVDDELGRLGRTLNEMLGRIQRAQTAERTALQRQQRLVADASHQLRTPLTVLKSEVEVALLGPADTVTLRRALESAGEEADRLTQLTDHLLQAAADDSTLVVERKPLSVRELAQTVADRHRSRASAAGRDITVTVRSDLVVSADQIRLEQALANLVDNALLHGAGPIELAGWRDATGTHLAVSDAGPGFGERAGASIFARFQRGNSLRRGNGLGLAIVHAIAAAHDGTVAVDSDDGARVTITLPD